MLELIKKFLSSKLSEEDLSQALGLVEGYGEQQYEKALKDFNLDSKEIDINKIIFLIEEYNKQEISKLNKKRE